MRLWVFKIVYRLHRPDCHAHSSESLRVQKKGSCDCICGSNQLRLGLLLAKLNILAPDLPLNRDFSKHVYPIPNHKHEYLNLDGRSLGISRGNGSRARRPYTYGLGFGLWGVLKGWIQKHETSIKSKWNLKWKLGFFRAYWWIPGMK